MSDTATTPSLIDFPCLFSIKVIGLHIASLKESVLQIVSELDPDFQAHEVIARTSSAEKYISLTLNVHAASREHLDHIYRALSSHPLVRMVL